MLLQTIYKLDSTGKIRTWQAEYLADRWRVHTGGPGRKTVTTGWTSSTGKQGRNDHQQAEFEANAEMASKLRREYRPSVAELSNVQMSPMLAKTYVTWEGNCFCQPKLDGIRALITKDGAFTRQHQKHLNVEHITRALAPIFAADSGIVLDGELYNHAFKDDFGRISSIVRKQDPTLVQRGEAERFLQFHCYDQFNQRFPERTFGQRWVDLQMCVMPVVKNDPSVVFVPTHVVVSEGMLDGFYAQYLEEGYEGQMVRLDAPYEPDKRSKHLLKRKEFITAEYPVVFVEEGNGNWAGLAKRLVFKLPDGRTCGAGMRGTHEQMRALMMNPLPAGTPVTIRHFTPTPDGMPRFPVAVDFHRGGRID